jgi:hypothetical protein
MIKEQEILGEKIMGYLRRNPNAGDTTEGIATWWLGQGKTQPPVQQVADVLEILTRKGLIRKRQLHGGAAIYKSLRRKE